MRFSAYVEAIMELTEFKECKISDALQITALYTWFKRRLQSGYVFKGEMHPFYEAVCVVSGRAGITAGKSVFTLSAGQMAIHAPDEFHAIWAADGAVEVLVCTFSANPPPRGVGVFSLLPDETLALCDAYASAQSTFDFDGIAVAGIKAGKSAAASAAVKRLESALIRIIDGAAAQKTACASVGAVNYINIVSEMERNIDRAMNADGLAALCGMSVSSLEKTVRRFAGAGAMELFGGMKIKRACALLEGAQSVKAVAYSLGFSSPYYFSAAFKKRTGVPPSQWRRGRVNR